MVVESNIQKLVTTTRKDDMNTHKYEVGQMVQHREDPNSRGRIVKLEYLRDREEPLEWESGLEPFYVLEWVEGQEEYGPYPCEGWEHEDQLILIG